MCHSGFEMEVVKDVTLAQDRLHASHPFLCSALQLAIWFRLWNADKSYVGEGARRSDYEACKVTHCEAMPQPESIDLASIDGARALHSGCSNAAAA